MKTKKELAGLTEQERKDLKITIAAMIWFKLHPKGKELEDLIVEFAVDVSIWNNTIEDESLKIEKDNNSKSICGNKKGCFSKFIKEIIDFNKTITGLIEDLDIAYLNGKFNPNFLTKKLKDFYNLRETLETESLWKRLNQLYSWEYKSIKPYSVRTLE